MLEVLVLSLTVMQEEASTLGLQIFRRKPKSYRFSLPPQLNSPGGKWTCWSGRCICLYGMHDWLLWWQQRGGPASDWLSSVLHEYVGEEDLEVKHQAGNPVTRLSDIHCASFDVWVRDMGHHKVPAVSPRCIWHVGTTQTAKVCLNCTEPSVARSSYWSLPVGHTCQIAAARAQWWSSGDELQAILPKSRRRLLVTRWESDGQPVVPLTSAFDMWRVYSILKILHSAHVSNASRRESRYLWWPKFHTHTSKLAQCMSDRGLTWFPAWCLT